MKLLQMYYNSKDKNYYIKNKTVCQKCGNILDQGDAFFIVSDYLNNLQKHSVVCVGCAREYKKMGQITEFRQGFISKIIGSVAIPVLLTKPRLQNYKGENVYSMARKNDGAKIIDKTKFALKDNWVDSLIESSKKESKKLKYKRGK